MSFVETRPAAVQIDYAPRPPLFRRRAARRVLFAMLAAAAVVAYLNRDFLRWAFRHQQFLRAQSRAMAYVAPPGTVALERDPAEAARLQSTAGSEYGTAKEALLSASQPIGGGAMWRPRVVTDYWSALSTTPLRNEAVVYCGERTSPGGARRLVIITTQSSYVIASLLMESRTFTAYVIDPATWRMPVPAISATSLSPRLKPPTEVMKPLRIYAGQPDPNDASRFTIDFLYDGKLGTVDGGLEDVGVAPAIRLKVRGGAQED